MMAPDAGYDFHNGTERTNINNTGIRIATMMREEFLQG